MIDVLRIAHLRIAPQEGNSEVGNCEVHHITIKKQCIKQGEKNNKQRKQANKFNMIHIVDCSV